MVATLRKVNTHLIQVPREEKIKNEKEAIFKVGVVRIFQI